MITAGDRLDHAIEKLEHISDGYESLLATYEEADAQYRIAFLTACAHSKEKSNAAKEKVAEQACLDQGYDEARRIAKVRHEAAKFQATQVRAIMDGLRSQIASSRVGIQ